MSTVSFPVEQIKVAVNLIFLMLLLILFSMLELEVRYLRLPDYELFVQTLNLAFEVDPIALEISFIFTFVK